MSELDRSELKAKADSLGISYPSNIPTDKLNELIKQHEKPSDESPSEVISGSEPEVIDTEDFNAAKIIANVQDPKVKVELSRGEKIAMKRDEATALVRVIVTCLNPNKSELQGEYRIVGTDDLGLFKRFIPFGKEWHVEKIFIDALKQQKYIQLRRRPTQYGTKDPNDDILVPHEVPEFAIQYLPPLTPQELKALQQDQIATSRIDD